MLYDQIDANKRRTVMLFAAFGVLLAVLSIAVDAFLLGGGGGPVAWAVITGILVVIVVAIVRFRADRIVLSGMGARPVNPEVPREVEAAALVENVAIAAGLPPPQVVMVDDPAPNAFATGRNPEQGVVGFTTGLLAKMNRQQVEAVAAHEMSHIANRDSLVGVTAAVLVGVIVIVCRLVLRMLFFGGARRRGGGRSGGGGHPIIFIVGLVVLVLAPIAAMLLKFSISRRREFLADANAVRLTRNPQAMISALEVLDSDHSQVDFSHGFAAHLWIEEPSDPQPGVLDRLFATHPPIPERIAALQRAAGAQI